MPTWAVPLLTLATALFSIGATLGVMKYKQATSDQRQTALMTDLKECVTKLQDVVTEVRIMKIAGVRMENAIEDHDKRLSELELSMAKLTLRRKR